MRTSLLSFAFSLLACASGFADSPGPSFTREIAPILVRACLRCHCGTDAAGRLDLSASLGARAAGESGAAAIVPGDAEASYLVERIRDREMPPPGKGTPLSAEEQAALVGWIAAGADWPQGERLSLFDRTTSERAGRDWWSLQPPVRPLVPQPKGADRARNEIDALILAALENKGLTLAADADRATWIRRATFDLWGLPPAPEDVAAFVVDQALDAYERLVDRLLASPRYGEHWGRHWLDVARFAESDGYETNKGRANAWPYRDYVIDAWNRDLPWPEFIRDQLAGDQITGERTETNMATGFLVAGAHDVVGSPDVELTRQQRLNDLNDMVATTGFAFMGLSVGCAKCHDHKFDPITQRDYYSLQAFFAGVRHGERLVGPRLDERQRQERDQLEQRLADVRQRSHRLLANDEPLAEAPAGVVSREGAELGETRLPPAARPRRAVHPLGNVDRFAPVAARFVRFTVLSTNSGEPCLDELEVFAAEDGQNLALASGGAKATASGVYAAGRVAIHQLAHVNDGQFGNGRSWISATVGGGWAEIELPSMAIVDRVEWARDRQGKYADRLPTAYRIEVALERGAWRTVATADDRRPYDLAASPSEIPIHPEHREALERLREEQASLERSLAALAPRKAYIGQFAEPETIYRLHRGEVMQRREPMPPAGPEFIGPPLVIAADAPEAERRLALARWLGDPAHPLTGRVLVNRVWQWHFGRGLIDTPNEFGFQGGRPSHAELLDWLATEFVAGGWRVKPLHRLILLSSVYRQSSQFRADAAAVDGDNRLLWRHSPQRLEAEALHDAILSVAGTLDLRMGGPGFDAFEPNGNYVKVYQPKQSFGAAEWRRMVYQNRPRAQLDPTFGSFDCPDASQSVGRRNVSTTALQALNLLNSPFVTQQAKLFAERLEREVPSDGAERNLAAKIERAFWLAFGRPPTAEEAARSRELIASEGLAPFCRALLNANEFIYVR